MERQAYMCELVVTNKNTAIKRCTAFSILNMLNEIKGGRMRLVFFSVSSVLFWLTTGKGQFSA